jgi:aminoglycoside 6'-N-acetyltransferase
MTPVAELVGPNVRLTPIVAQDADALLTIHATPEVAAFWDPPDADFPLADDPESARFTIRVGDDIAGLIQYGEETAPKYRHAQIDIFVGPAFHRRGVASEAIGLVIDHLLAERGHHRITIDPAAHNEAAIACYAKCGFERVGIMRNAERDTDGRGWHDVLLMELVVDPG